MSLLIFSITSSLLILSRPCPGELISASGTPVDHLLIQAVFCFLLKPLWDVGIIVIFHLIDCVLNISRNPLLGQFPITSASVVFSPIPIVSTIGNQFLKIRGGRYIGFPLTPKLSLQFISIGVNIDGNRMIVAVIRTTQFTL